MSLAAISIMQARSSAVSSTTAKPKGGVLAPMGRVVAGALSTSQQDSSSSTLTGRRITVGLQAGGGSSATGVLGSIGSSFAMPVDPTVAAKIEVDAAQRALREVQTACLVAGWTPPSSEASANHAAAQNAFYGTSGQCGVADFSGEQQAGCSNDDYITAAHAVRDSNVAFANELNVQLDALRRTETLILKEMHGVSVKIENMDAAKKDKCKDELDLYRDYEIAFTPYHYIRSYKRREGVTVGEYVIAGEKVLTSGRAVLAKAEIVTS